MRICGQKYFFTFANKQLQCLPKLGLILNILGRVLNNFWEKFTEILDGETLISIVMNILSHDRFDNVV